MLEKLLSLDTQLFVYLNGLGSETYDGFWLLVTNQLYWIPFFLLLLFFIYKRLGAKQSGYLLLFVVLLIVATDQLTNLVKYTVQRTRPCNNLEINSFIRVVQVRKSFSFFSGHAANTMAVASFLFLIFKRRFPAMGFLFIWPLIFAYSRIYLGLHYPLDILSGYCFGLLTGWLMYKAYGLGLKKNFPDAEALR